MFVCARVRSDAPVAHTLYNSRNHRLFGVAVSLMVRLADRCPPAAHGSRRGPHAATRTRMHAHVRARECALQ